jgi:hypothetical protein
MMNMEKSSTARSGYIAIFLISWVIPAMHFINIDAALEHTRYSFGLMPGTFLFLKWFGQLSWVTPIVVAILFGLSWRNPALAKPTTVAKLSIWLYVFTVVYAAYCGFLLSIVLYET